MAPDPHFEDAEPAQLLQEGAAALGLALSPARRQDFLFYGEELLHWNRRVNLTGLHTPQEVVLKHFLDSLAVHPWIKDLASLADLGSGAGFPGLPLKLVLPELHLTLIDASSKKTAFLHYLVAHLRLTGVEIRHLHLSPSLTRRWGAVFQGVITRATFPLDRYLELAAPLVKPGGRLLAMKGPHLEASQWQQAEALAARYECQSPRQEDYCLPLSGDRRRLIIWEKLAAP